MSQFAEAWQLNNEAHLFLIQHLSSRHLGDRYAPKTRPVASQFAHIHNVRFRWLERAAPEMAQELAQFARGSNLGKSELIEALSQSGQMMARFFRQSEERGAVVHWEGEIATFLAYFIARESHHRGLALAALESCGHRPPGDIIDGLWDWGRFM